MIYLFLAQGFEEIEALTPLDILRRGKVDIKTVGIGSTYITGSHGIEVKTDMEISELQDFSDMEAVILPGGMPGTLNLEANRTVISAVQYCQKNNKIIAAICAAPSILGHLGILQNKEATAYPGFETELSGAKLSEKYTVRDGNIITARGMGVSVDFGLTILAAVKNQEIAHSIKNSIQYPS